MAAAYSMDLRSRVLKDSDVGLSSKELAERYHVSRAWVDALKQRQRETRSIAFRFAGLVKRSTRTPAPASSIRTVPQVAGPVDSCGRSVMRPSLPGLA